MGSLNAGVDGEAQARTEHRDRPAQSVAPGAAGGEGGAGDGRVGAKGVQDVPGRRRGGENLGCSNKIGYCFCVR